MSQTNNIRPRKTLDAIEPYSPGKPIWEVQKELGLERVIKLASNENPLGPSPKALEAIRNGLAELNRYPDADASVLKQAIAAEYGVAPQQVIPTNGADELITLISEAFLEAGDEVIVPSPSFSEYDFGAHIMGATVVPVPFAKDFQYDVDAIIEAVTEKTKLVYICTPNNPTGTYIAKADIEKLLKAVKGALIVFDAAYSHFADEADYTNGIEFVQAGYPVLTLQTFSKIYGIAGIRVGYGIAPEFIIQAILKVKEPFNVNSLAQIAATAAIGDTEHVRSSQEVNKAGREQLYKTFDDLGLDYTKSLGNFVLVHVGPEGEKLYKELMAKGVIVRYGKTWGLPEHIRVSVGTPEENAFFGEVLTGLLAKQV
ncbi:histidinol-phosphate transaminase [Planococcus sp. N028]|uniref:Histidinol-phosphate aminotransferase n=1 Tax=Planococcus shixiaomingii TaxID=3058393 RepID=A0ABT8N5T8_9BACL|nr:MULTISPECIES: histidinol-phosphate transaminase [unclassified Planococcus (in: firmicutes)]MDN7243113.1 histidinol-phosphate transaminase [Planococcus sp. N028]WKA55058.1 histidinol-phosphate transaminase [Planococcus sp. N022]